MTEISVDQAKSRMEKPKRVEKLYNKEDEAERRFSEKELNGALLPEIVYNTPSKIKINRDLLMRLLEVENSIRTDFNNLDQYDDPEGSNYQYIDEEMRLDALKQLLPGVLNKSIEEIDWYDAFKAYNLACGEYINDVEVREKVVWMKYDKTRLGKLRIGYDVITEDLTLYDLNKNPYDFKSLVDDSIPTLLVGGSLTWPPFRVFGVDALKNFYDKYVTSGKINMIVVYISEAHARDQWPLSNVFVINQHKDLDERIAAAKLYIETFDIPFTKHIFVDSFNSKTIENTYSCWPERGYIFQHGKIQYMAFAYLEDLIRWPEETEAWFEKNIK